MSQPYDCPTCGQTHPRGCRAHKKANRGGGPCLRAAVPGSTVCHYHGGTSPQAKAKAAERLAETEAREQAARFAARTDIHPAEALLELVHHQAGIVDYWRARVEEVRAEDLEWGTTREKTGGDDRGTTNEAAPHIAYKLLTEAQRDLAAYASAALKAGVDERRVRLAEQQGTAVATVIRAILERLHLTPDQQALVPVVVPEQLRQLTHQEAPR